MVATINKMFQQADKQLLKVTDIKIVGSGSKIDISLEEYSKDNESKGNNKSKKANKSKGCASSSNNEEISMNKKDNKWCELCLCNDCIQNNGK